MSFDSKPRPIEGRCLHEPYRPLGRAVPVCSAHSLICSRAGTIQRQPAAQIANAQRPLLQFAEQQNGLHDLNGTSWHVRASWQLLDPKGKPEKQGTWEEWWAGPHQWEVIHDSPDFEQTDWSTPRGRFELNVHGSRAWIDAFIDEVIVHPIRIPPAADAGQFTAGLLRKGKVTLHCVTFHHATPTLRGVLTSRGMRTSEDCFDAGMSDLRMEIGSLVQVTLNSIVKFQGRYLAREIHIERIGMPTIDIRLDAIDEPAPAQAGQTDPPPQATPALITLPPESQNPNSFSQPHYPPTAYRLRLSGTVAVWATIGKDGTVSHLEVIACPTIFQQAALDYVKTLRFKPVLLRGIPVEANITTLINFMSMPG